MQCYSKSYVHYIQELSKDKYNHLSKNEELETVALLASGSVDAKSKIITAHLRFVVYLLNDFKIPPRIDRMDLIQEGNAGLIDGLSRFNAQQNCRVSTYVQFYIKWYIARALGIYSKTLPMQELPENFNFDDLEGSVNVQEKVQQDIRDFISSILDKKELKIVSLLFGLEPPYKPLTLKEASSLLHLNSETVRLTRSRALDKIKEHQNQIAELV